MKKIQLHLVASLLLFSSILRADYEPKNTTEYCKVIAEKMEKRFNESLKDYNELKVKVSEFSNSFNSIVSEINDSDRAKLEAAYLRNDLNEKEKQELIKEVKLKISTLFKKKNVLLNFKGKTKALVGTIQVTDRSFLVTIEKEGIWSGGDLVEKSDLRLNEEDFLEKEVKKRQSEKKIEPQIVFVKGEYPKLLDYLNNALPKACVGNEEKSDTSTKQKSDDLELQVAPKLKDSPAVCRNSMTMVDIAHQNVLELNDKYGGYDNRHNIKFSYESKSPLDYQLSGKGQNDVLSINGAKLGFISPGRDQTSCGACTIKLIESVSSKTELQNRRVTNPIVAVNTHQWSDEQHTYLNRVSFLLTEDKIIDSISCDFSEEKTEEYPLFKSIDVLGKLTLKQYQDALSWAVQSCPALKITYLPDTKACKEVRIGSTKDKNWEKNEKISEGKTKEVHSSNAKTLKKKFEAQADKAE